MMLRWALCSIPLFIFNEDCYLSSKYAHFLWNKNVQIIRSS